MARDEAYYEADEIIKAIRQAGSTKLDLSNYGSAHGKLTELPESLSDLQNLESLDLSYNLLSTVAEVIGKLGEATQLQSLDLSYNAISTLPETVGALGSLKHLQALDFSSNELTGLPESLGQLLWVRFLDLSRNRLVALPISVGRLRRLQRLLLPANQLTTLPESIGKLTRLESVDLSNNRLTTLPESIGKLTRLESVDLSNNQLTTLPESIGKLTRLKSLNLSGNQLKDIPTSLAQVEGLHTLQLYSNPLTPELSEAQNQGLEAVRIYLRAKAAAQMTLREAKLILVGEGDVGKSCLLAALRDEVWEENRPTTHGIEIKQVKVTAPDTKEEITLNGWDFGGQRVYRPTHQLFFSAPAVYLVVWKPREGLQQGFIKEWIKLIKYREPDAKILVVATHGGPKQRQPDIDRQELWDLFGKETIIDFFRIDSKPDANGKRRGLAELKKAIAGVASRLPEMDRTVPKSWQAVRDALYLTEKAYLHFEDLVKLCHKHQLNEEEAHVFVTIEHRLGHLIHYQHDPILRDIVILKPNWLATAISFVQDDETTRKAHGLVRVSRLGELWDDATRPAEFRYPMALHEVFVRLMERFDLCYRVTGLSPNDDPDPAYLIAQLVPDTSPEKDLARVWPSDAASGDIQRVQICRIVDKKGASTHAEGLFYQLIVRLHKYSLGRMNYSDSVHWQRGLVLDYDYNGRALLRHLENDVQITVRAPYPERFLAMLTEEVKYLVESFWEGLQCDIMVPCLNPVPCLGLFDVRKLIENKRRGRPEQPCSVCNEWQSIDSLLLNAPAAQPDATTLIFAEFADVKADLAKARQQITYLGEKTMGRFDRLDDRTRRTLSRVDKTYTDLLQVFTDEAKDGPRLFSFEPINRKALNPKEWTSAKFRLTLWCEHSRLPLPALNGKDSKKGVYEIVLTREWFVKAAPYLRLLTGTLNLVLPVAFSGIKLGLNDAAYKAIENELEFGKELVDAVLTGSKTAVDWLGSGDSIHLEHGAAIRAEGETLRELHAVLRDKHNDFGGLVRVMDKRREFLWVHPRFAGEY